MELAGLEPATSWGAIQALSCLEFVHFPGLSRPAAASSCDQLPPDYQGIPGYLVTGFGVL